MTLRRLLVLLHIPAQRTGSRVPTVKQRRNSFIPIIARTTEDYRQGITVFDDGVVVYGNGDHVTVFYIEDVTDYTYDVNRGDIRYREGEAPTNNININDLYEMEWWFPLMLVGEDRLESNNDRRQFAYSLDWYKEFGIEPIDVKNEFEDRLCDKIRVYEALNQLNEHQRDVMIRSFIINETYDEIAAKYGVGRSAIANVVKRAKDAMINKL
ncbi:MAG: sigma-70 family RNA polymerase sigma factor [Lachnospiraceae bacterium]|nr:sigma-70 family RNA polymerase sigma factor [Lachnospiraceae bacterium]